MVTKYDGFFFYTGLRTDNMTNISLQLYLVIDLLKACVDQKRKNTFDQSATLDENPILLISMVKLQVSRIMH